MIGGRSDSGNTTSSPSSVDSHKAEEEEEEVEEEEVEEEAEAEVEEEGRVEVASKKILETVATSTLCRMRRGRSEAARSEARRLCSTRAVEVGRGGDTWGR